MTWVLSPRQLQICEMLAVGYGLKQVADKLHISIKTVSTHKHRACEKMGIVTDNTIVLVHFMLARGKVKNLFSDEPNG